MSINGFTFRHRVGKVDWRIITSVKVEEVVLNSKVLSLTQVASNSMTHTLPILRYQISELQQLLDPLVFSEFTTEDVRNNSIGSITHLVKLLQLTAEYLLHYQEHQFKTLRDLNRQLEEQETLNNKLKKQCISLKEDARIYQRQLAMLRNSLLNQHEPVVPSIRKRDRRGDDETKVGERRRNEG